jgi:hypothetical protein
MKPFRCPHCPRRSTSEIGIEIHVQRAHIPGEDLAARRALEEGDRNGKERGWYRERVARRVAA